MHKGDGDSVRLWDAISKRLQKVISERKACPVLAKSYMHKLAIAQDKWFHGMKHLNSWLRVSTTSFGFTFVQPTATVQYKVNENQVVVVVGY